MLEWVRRFFYPTVKVVYKDEKNSRVFTSERHKLKGKPDYLLKRDDYLIPVEVKSTTARYPHWNHIMQAAAYCLLIEDVFGTTVPYAILQYANIAFKIPFTTSLRRQLAKIMHQMRIDLEARSASPTSTPSKCANCSQKGHCPA